LDPLQAWMEAESIQSLSPLIDAADQWSEWLLLLPLLVALEAVLSADNAIALAAISRRLKDPAQQGQALNLGLALALLFRLALIGVARWVLDFWPLQLLAAGYLLWLCVSSLWLGGEDSSSPAALKAEGGAEPASGSPGSPSLVSAFPADQEAPAQRGHLRGLASVVTTLALTDLAFSLDSVAAAVAVSDNLLLVMVGGVIGVVALRLTSALFIRWIGEFSHLESAGYLAVGLVGIRLVLRVLLPELVPPEWLLLALVALLFGWGFSRRVSESAQEVAP
jgi:YkoY family integral membrane protein